MTLFSGIANNNKIEYQDGASIAPFGRLRVANPYTVFDSKQLVNSSPLFWDDQQISGASTTSTYVTNNSSTQLSVQGNIAGRRVRQTFRRFNYQPGKGTLCLFTGVLIKEGGTGITGVNRKIGYFDDSDGLFFQYGSNTMNVALRTFTSGSAVTTLIPQSSWNVDKMDGYGASGIKIDFTKAQIFVIDFEWLGTGRVRYGFNFGGITYYCHYISNANSLNTVYMRTPNLPLRYEIESLGTGSATTASLLHICSSVVSEGGREDNGYQLSVSRGINALTTGNDTNNYGLLALRLQSGIAFSATIKQIDISIMTPSSTSAYLVQMFLNPTVAGTALSFSNVSNSVTQLAITDNTNLVSGGISLFSVYGASNRSSMGAIDVPNDLTIGSSIAGVSDIIVITVQPVTNQSTTPYYCSLSFKEEI